MALFQLKDFIGAGGAKLNWKIECDALSDEDWETIATVCAPKLPKFGRAVGVPQGGVRLAREMDKFCTPSSRNPVLIVDDVWTTGRSMNQFAALINAERWLGFVAFDRSAALPKNVYCFMTLGGT